MFFLDLCNVPLKVFNGGNNTFLINRDMSPLLKWYLFLYFWLKMRYPNNGREENNEIKSDIARQPFYTGFFGWLINMINQEWIESGQCIFLEQKVVWKTKPICFRDVIKVFRQCQCYKL